MNFSTLLKQVSSIISLPIETTNLNSSQKTSFNTKVTSNNCLTSKLKKHSTSLSKTDIIHCEFVLLEYSLKETANLLNVSVNTVKSARYRAKSKIGLHKNQCLKYFLENI